MPAPRAASPARSSSAAMRPTSPSRSQDANGKVLKTMSLGAQSAGTVNFDWDGTTDGGEPTPAPARSPSATYAQNDGTTVDQPAARLGAGRRGLDAVERRSPTHRCPASARFPFPPSVRSADLTSKGAMRMSFYTSLSGLQAAQTDMSTISHNLANVCDQRLQASRRPQFADVIASSLAVRTPTRWSARAPW